MDEGSMASMPAASPEAVFSWQPVITGSMVNKERWHRLGLLGGGGALMIGGVALAVIGNGGFSREMVVVGFMLVSIGILGLIDSRKARSTTIAVDRDGVLSVVQSGKVRSVDLRGVSAISVRRRTGQPQWKWSIEAVQGAGGWHTELAPIASYFNLPVEAIEGLEVELRRFLTWANPAASQTTPGASAVSTPTGHQPVAAPVTGGQTQVRGTIESTPTQFLWTPPRGEKAERNRTRYRLGLAVTFLLIAAAAAASVWGDGLDDVALSMFAPLLYLLIGIGIDRAFLVGAKFKVAVDASGLTIDRGRAKSVTIPLAEVISIDISTRSSTVSAADTTTTSNHWFLTIPRRSDQPGKPAFAAMIPVGLGGAFRRDDAIGLEAELRRRCGVVA